MVLGFIQIRYASRVGLPCPVEMLIILHVRSSQTVFSLYSLQVRLSFLTKIAASEAGELEGAFLPPLGIEDKAKFSISFVLNMYVMFFSTKLIFIT